MGKIAAPKDYWIAPTAIHITLNALGDYNRIQGSVASGAAILCYIKGVDGLEYDNGHNFRSWPLSLSPTYFNSDTEKYVYAAIPKSTQTGTHATIVFPSQKIDIDGKAEPTTDPSTGEEVPGEQIGSDNYYYIWLQGIISSSAAEQGAQQPRSWTQQIQTGLLSSDEAMSSLDTDWYSYSAEDERVTFLKEILLNDVAKFLNLKADGLQLGGSSTLTGVAIPGVTSEKSTADIVTPAFMDQFGNTRYLSRINDDTASGVIRFLAGLAVGDGYGIDQEGTATLAALLSDNFQSGEQGAGFGIYNDDHGVSTAEVDKLIVRMKAVFQELEIKKKSFSAGDLGFSDAANKLLLVLPMNGSGEVITSFNDAVAYRCCWLMKDGEEAVTNDWHVDDQARCQTFNIKAGVYTNVSNRYYWRKVLNAGEDFDYEGVSYNYIDLAANATGEYMGTTFTKGCQSGIINDVPAAGDDVVQLGNQSDTDRQNYTEIIVNGQDAPAIKQYQGINDYTLSEKLVRGDYYDRQKGTYRSVTYGDFYAGDKERDGGYAEYDKATNTFNVKGTLRVGSTLDDGRDVNDLGVRKGNLLRNSGFTGEYESESVTSTTDVNADTIIYSDPFDLWEQSGCTAVADDESASGMSATIGQLTQVIDGGLTVGHWYIFSFRGRYGRVTVTVGGVSKTFELTDALTRYDFPFICLSDAPFTITGNGSSVMELQLMAGNIPSEWHSAHKDNDSALAEFYSNEYLRNAITEASTTINGGLIMSQILKVGNYRNKQMVAETGGMSGAYTDGKSPFLWGGGTMEQAIYTIMKYAGNPRYQPTDTEVAHMAKFVVTHGGRAILNDIILRGYIYALGGVFNGTIYADKGMFNGIVTNEWKLPQDADGQYTVVGAGSPDVYVLGREDLSIMCVMPVHSMQSPEVAIEVQLPVSEYYIGKEVKIMSSVGSNLVYEGFVDAVRVIVNTPNTENNHYIYGIEQYQVTVGSTTFTYYATDSITFDSGVITLVGAPYDKIVTDGEQTTVVRQTQWFVKSHTYRIKKNGQHGRGIVSQNP